MISKLAMVAKKTIEAAWLNGPSYDLATQAAEALESAQLLQSPDIAAELERLQARVVELEAQRKALAERLSAGQRWERGRNPELVSENFVSQSELRSIFGIPLAPPWADGITRRRIAPTQALREDTPAALRAEDAADILTLAPAQHADSSYNAAFQSISLELTATPEQWVAWQTALDVDLARTTNRGSCVTSHAVWRGIRVVICCWFAKEAGE